MSGLIACWLSTAPWDVIVLFSFFLVYYVRWTECGGQGREEMLETQDFTDINKEKFWRGRQAVPVVLEAGSPMSVPPSTLWLWGGPSKFLTVHFCYHIGKKKKIERWGPFSWVQIPLTKATVLRLSFPPKASSPKCITLETRVSFLLDTGFPPYHSDWLQDWRSSCLSLPVSSSLSGSRERHHSPHYCLWPAEWGRDAIATHYCLWPSEWK